jgi:hypothetical protein
MSGASDTTSTYLQRRRLWIPGSAFGRPGMTVGSA